MLSPRAWLLVIMSQHLQLTDSWDEGGCQGGGCACRGPPSSSAPNCWEEGSGHLPVGKATGRPAGGKAERGGGRRRLYAKGRMTGALRKPAGSGSWQPASLQSRGARRAPGNRRRQPLCPLEQLRPPKDEGPHWRPRWTRTPALCSGNKACIFAHAKWFLRCLPVRQSCFKDWYASKFQIALLVGICKVWIVLFFSQPHLPPLGLSGRVFVMPQLRKEIWKDN